MKNFIGQKAVDTHVTEFNTELNYEQNCESPRTHDSNEEVGKNLFGALDQNPIHISAETRTRLVEDFEAMLGDDSYKDEIDAKVNSLISRAQAYPDRHVLDIMYQDDLKVAVKSVISYFALPMINFCQELPMHANFMSVFDFCGHWVASSPFNKDCMADDELDYVVNHIKFYFSTMLLSDKLEEILAHPFDKKQDFLDLMNYLRRHWYPEDVLMPNIFWALLSILDFPAIDFDDTPSSRLTFACMLKDLTAFWPETIWNWGDFDIDNIA